MPERMSPSSQTKPAWRRLFLDARATQSEGSRAADAAALTRHFHAEILPSLGPGSTLCAYAPIGSEPGTLGMLDDAVAAAVRVLLPLTGPPGPLRWAQYTSEEALRPARHGLREPDGPALEPAAVASASVVLIPALGADRRGVRLGRGAGYYDRTLPLAAPNARLVVVVRDNELVAQLPHDPHDVPMTHALTPDQGLVPLGNLP